MVPGTAEKQQHLAAMFEDLMPTSSFHRSLLEMPVARAVCCDTGAEVTLFFWSGLVGKYTILYYHITSYYYNLLYYITILYYYINCYQSYYRLHHKAVGSLRSYAVKLNREICRGFFSRTTADWAWSPSSPRDMEQETTWNPTRSPWCHGLMLIPSP